MGIKPSLANQQHKCAAVPAAVQYVVSRKSTQLNALPTASGVVAPTSTLEELVGATASSPSGKQSQVQSDFSSKASSNLVITCKPITNSHLEAEVWVPSYAESREPEVQNAFAWDYGTTTFD